MKYLVDFNLLPTQGFTEEGRILNWEGEMGRQELMENISRTLILMQKTLKISSEQLAKKSGVTQPCISQIRSCKRLASLPILTKLATVFGISLDVLTGYDVSAVERDDGKSKVSDSTKLAVYRSELFAMKADVERFLNMEF